LTYCCFSSKDPSPPNYRPWSSRSAASLLPDSVEGVLQVRLKVNGTWDLLKLLRETERMILLIYFLFTLFTLHCYRIRVGLGIP